MGDDPMKCALAGLVLVLSLTAPAVAQDRQTLGWGRIFDNDAIGDGQDRWHTGSYTVSVLQGTGWTGNLPSRFGDLLEYRASAQTTAPANLVNPGTADRLYAGALTLGLHSHALRQGFDTSLGGDLVLTGPMTGLRQFQSAAHDAIGIAGPAASIAQIGNALYPTLTAEAARSIAFGDHVTIRPFVAAQAGVETYLRAGGDVVIGSFGRGAMMLRDDVTGQRYRAIPGDPVPALSLTLGGDVARVYNSALLPSGGPVAANDTRTRLRAGVQWQGQSASAFYGVTYLGPEFSSQPEGQLVGSLNVSLRF